ncbi:MAG: YybS family protein, partial [Desulfobulbaceae bacterium]|nr:YybS family protein [Desulfobulbaceae bacterium]
MKEPGTDSHPNGFSALKTSLLLSCCFILPIFSPVPFSWFTGFLAVPVFYLLRTVPKQRGKVIVLNTILLVGILALASFEKLPAIILTLTFIPLGYSLHASAEKDEAPWMGVGKGTLVLAATWLLFGLGLAAGYKVNPYTELKQNLDNLLSELYETAKTSNLSADVLLDFKERVDFIRELTPRILPGALLTSTLTTVLINQLLGNVILMKTKPERVPWPEYREWAIPDKFVWVLITAGIVLLIGSGTFRDL